MSERVEQEDKTVSNRADKEYRLRGIEQHRRDRSQPGASRELLKNDCISTSGEEPPLSSLRKPRVSAERQTCDRTSLVPTRDGEMTEPQQTFPSLPHFPLSSRGETRRPPALISRPFKHFRCMGRRGGMINREN